MMEGVRTLLANATGSVRRVQVHGRQYLVAPVTMIVPGVLAGSNGPLYYPPDEVSKDPQRWNGVPLTLGHPRSPDGYPVSGRTPEVLNTYQLGNVYRARWDGKALRGEAWFDEELTKKNGPDVHANLLSGRVTELSTGLFTDDEPVANGKDPVSGKPYTHVARNYRPDHLAVLVGVKGACSVADGCGVLVNAKYSFDSEKCPGCGAAMEGDPDNGRCNRCGKRYGKKVDKPKGNSEKSLARRLVRYAVNAILGRQSRPYGDQPHSSDTGRFKAPGAGTGKSDTRDHALLGATELTDQDITLGSAAAVYGATTGTPGAKPPWASDAAKWERATALAAKAGDSPTSHRYYAVTVHIYRGLGGGIDTSPSPTSNAFCPTGEGGLAGGSTENAGLDMTPDKACKILHDGTVHGNPLTERQRGLFGARCGLRKKGKSKKAKRNQSAVVNQSSEDTEMATKAENVKTLTANCECWKGRDKVLEAMDEQLVADLVKQNSDAEELNLVVNELREEFGAEEDEVALNAMPAFIKKKVKAKDAEPDDDDATDDDDDDKDETYKKNQRGGTTVVNKESVLAVLNSLSQDELLALPGMAGIRERDQLSQQILTNQKSQLVDRLTENVTDPVKKKARREKLGKLSLNELMDRVEDLPPPARSASGSTSQSTPAPTFYLGAGPTGNAGHDDEFKPKPMSMPKINWAEEKKLLDAGASNRAG